MFLQTWRASIIPLLAVPVSIVGTFAVMYLLGVSINALSLFGLVLAIGIVVDDAIVVVENVERNIASGLTPREATYQAMREVSGPIIAIGVEGMLYMSSQATTDGLMMLTVTFRLGMDADKAQQLVQNRVGQAEPRLPEEVRRLGITTIKSSPDFIMVVHLTSPNERYDVTY